MVEAKSQDRALEGRVAIVTGASRGIGRGCAVGLGARGATVYCTARRTSGASPPEPGSVEAVAELEHAERREAGGEASADAQEIAAGREASRQQLRHRAARADLDFIHHSLRAISSKIGNLAQL